MECKRAAGAGAQNGAMDPRRRFFFRARPAAAAPQRPPGALPEAAFEQACTRCDACIPACPPQVIRRGSGGFPEMDFSRAGCDFCGACQRACTPGALAGAPGFGAWKAHISSSCLAQRGVDCRVCGDACDARALRFPPRRGGAPVPVLDLAACTGCGACVSGCPAQAIQLVAPA